MEDVQNIAKNESNTFEYPSFSFSIPIHTLLPTTTAPFLLLLGPLLHKRLVLRPPRLGNPILPRHLHQRQIRQLLRCHLDEGDAAVFLHADEDGSGGSAVFAEGSFEFGAAEVEFGVGSQFGEVGEEEFSLCVCMCVGDG